MRFFRSMILFLEWRQSERCINFFRPLRNFMANDGNGIPKRSPGGLMQFNAASKITFSTGTALTAQWNEGTRISLLLCWVTSHTEADGELGGQQGDESATDRQRQTEDTSLSPGSQHHCPSNHSGHAHAVFSWAGGDVRIQVCMHSPNPVAS